MKLKRVGFALLFILFICPKGLLAQIISCPAVLVDPIPIQQSCVGGQVFLDIFIDDESLGHVEWTYPDGSTEIGFDQVYIVPELEDCNHTQVINWVLVCDGLGATIDAGTVSINTFVLPSAVSSDGCEITLVGGDCPDISVTGGNNTEGTVYTAQEGETGTVVFDVVNNAAPDDCNSTQVSADYDCQEQTTQEGVIELKVYLEGYLQNDGLMRTTLANNGLLPTSQPFNQFPYYYFGMHSVDAHESNIVDWLLIELRNADNPGTLVERKALLLRNDGQVVDTEGNASIIWNNLGEYHIVVKHRSHLGIQTAQTIDNTQGTSYDFSTAIEQAAGTGQQAMSNGIAAMLGGDYDNSGTVNFFDFIAWLNLNNVTSVYENPDVDGTGTINFFDFIRYLSNVNTISVPSIP